MIAFSPKALAVVAITMSLSPSALACLRLYGTIYQDFTAEDNGVVTCAGDIDTGDNNLGMFPGCEPGFPSLSQANSFLNVKTATTATR